MPLPFEREAGWAVEPRWKFKRKQKYLGCAESPTPNLSARSLFDVPAMLCWPLCGFAVVFAPVYNYRITLDIHAETHVGLRYEGKLVIVINWDENTQYYIS